MTHSGSEAALTAADIEHPRRVTSDSGSETASKRNLIDETHRQPSSSSHAIPPVPAGPQVSIDTTVSSGKIIIALPAYNEAKSLVPQLSRIRRAMNNFGREFHVIVVDDGSTDDTGLVASQHSFQMDLTLVSHKVNRGFGAAVESAVRKAAELAGEHDIIVTMDADNTQPPESIHRMVALIEDGFDVVIASRFRAGARVVGVPFIRNIYSLGARAVFTLMFPTRGVRDYTCGFRAFRASTIHRAFETYGDDFFSESGFSTTADLLLKVRKLPRKTLFYEIPMILRYDQKEGPSKMNGMQTIIKTLGLVARRRLGR